MGKYKHMWGQGTVNLGNKDLSSLKLQRCIKRVHVKKGKALEVGCGAGMFLRSIKSLSPSLDCYGGDIDEDSIKLAKSHDDNISYMVFNAEALPFNDNTFDVIFMFDIVEHVENTDNLLNEIVRISKIGSVIHIFIPCEKEPFTLFWILNRIKIGHELKKELAGHIRQFTKKEFIAKIQEKNLTITSIEYSTYIIGQLLDISYYALQKIRPLRESVLRAHSSSNVTGDSNQSMIIKIIKKIIGLAFLISYIESVLLKQSLFAQGVHLTCKKE